MVAVSVATGGDDPRITQAWSTTFPPLHAKNVARLARGEAPGVEMPWALNINSMSGYFKYTRSEFGYPYFQSPAPRMRVMLSRFTDIHSADLLQMRDAQGARIRRDAQGHINFVASPLEWYFVQRTAESFKIVCYAGGNCGTDAEGQPIVLPGSHVKYSEEFMEGKPGLKNGTRQILVRQLIRGAKYLAVLDFEETKERTQMMRHNYKGETADPAALYAKGFLQRVYWKDGPGFTQIGNSEVLQPDGSWKMDQHYVETWKVDPKGRVEFVKTENFLQPKKEGEEKKNENPDNDPGEFN